MSSFINKDIADEKVKVFLLLYYGLAFLFCGFDMHIIMYFTYLYGFAILITLTHCEHPLIFWAILILPLYLSFFNSIARYVLKYLLWISPDTFEPIVETLNLKGNVINTSIRMSVINLFAIISTMYLPTFICVLLLLSVLSIDMVVLYFIIKFPFTIRTFLWNCHLSEYYSFFRTREWSFVRKYNSKTCDRMVEWNEDFKCLTCQNRTNIVYNQCGHISVCYSCLLKLRKKEYSQCIICGIQNDNVSLFYHKSEPSFIQEFFKRPKMEIKLMRNQYVNVNV